MLQAEVEETIKRIQSQKGVQGIIIVNAEGIRQMRNASRRLSWGQMMCFIGSMTLIKQRDLCCYICSISMCFLNRHPNQKHSWQLKHSPVRR